MSRYCICILVLILARSSVAQEYSYGTFVGGPYFDELFCIEAAGEEYYIAGCSDGPSFPFEVNGYQESGDPRWYGSDGLVIRFGDNDQPNAATYIGGSGNDLVKAMAVAPDGVVVVCQTSSATFHAPYPGPNPYGILSPNILIAKFSLDLSELLWTQWILGNDEDIVHAADADARHVILTGITASNDLPTENSDPHPNYAWDSFAMLLDCDDGEILAFRYLYGGQGTSCKLIGGGVSLIAGDTGVDIPVTPGAFDTLREGWNEAFVGAYDSDLEPIWLSYLGGAGEENAPSVSLDEEQDEIIVVMETASGDMPVLGVHWSAEYVGDWDLYICGISSDGGTLNWGGYSGVSYPAHNSEYHYPKHEIDDDGHLYIVTTSYADDLPTGPDPIFPSPTRYGSHGQVFKYSCRSHELLAATYIPGDAPSFCTDVALVAGDARFVGHFWTTYVQDYLTPTPDGFDLVVDGSAEGFLIRLSDESIVAIEPPATTPPTPSLGRDLTITSDDANLYLASAAFSVPPARVDVYDLKGRRLLTRRSLLADTDHGPAHVLPREALGRIAGGTYVVAVTCEDRRVSGTVVLRE